MEPIFRFGFIIIHIVYPIALLYQSLSHLQKNKIKQDNHFFLFYMNKRENDKQLVIILSGIEQII